MSFCNSRPTYLAVGTSILFKENFIGKIENIKGDDARRIFSISFALNTQHYQIINLYGLDKPYQRENVFQSLNDYTTNIENTIIGGDFNMMKEVRDKMGITICNTHFVESATLNELIKLQSLHGT